MNENKFLSDENNFSEKPITENDSETATTEEVEIELDPEISPTNSLEDVNVNNPQTRFGEDSKTQPITPVPPIMPKIEKNDYQPLEQPTFGKGVKVFATILVLLIVVSASLTGGYYLGKGTTYQPQKVTVDLASKPLPEKALAVSQIYTKTSPSIVGVCVYNEDEGIAGAATGVIYSEDGYIVTNDHIYDGIPAAKFKIYTHDKKVYSAVYVAGDTRSDLAVLKISNAKKAKFIPAQFGNSDESVVGESVIAIGRPNGATSPSIASEGIISVLSTRVNTTSNYSNSLIQTDTALNPGSSGGALCNIYGQVIGITSAKRMISGYDSVGYAIPTTTMKKVVDSLIKHKTVEGRAKLGISYLHIDELSAELANLPCGLKIATIDKDSGLYGKSVKANDIITHVNKTKITDANIILDIIDAASPNDTLDLKIYSIKNKKTIDIQVKLLKDPGGSSYTTKASNKNNSNKNNKPEYNSSEFNFPNGE